MAASKRYRLHFLSCPELSHVFGFQFLDFIIQMLPKHFSKGVHDSLHFVSEPQLFLAASAILEILLEDIQSGVNAFMLLFQMLLILEAWHSLSKYGKDVPFLNTMVHGQGGAELVSERKKLAY